MSKEKIDLVREHEASLNRARLKYSFIARVFFKKMDILTGSKTDYSKMKLIEMLAAIPYRSWEALEYVRMTLAYRNKPRIEQSKILLDWAREAQDNEYWHLIVINEKMRADGIQDRWYLKPPIPFVLILGYMIFAKLLAVFSIKKALLFNAAFEDHAEHVYAQFVADNPDLENQKVESNLVKDYAACKTWADIFRRICLDERDHRNHSLYLAKKPQDIVTYTGMPKHIIS